MNEPLNSIPTNSKRRLFTTLFGIFTAMGLFALLMQMGFYDETVTTFTTLTGGFMPVSLKPASPLQREFSGTSPANAMLSIDASHGVPEIKLHQADINRAVLFYQHSLPVAIRSDIRLDKVQAKPYQIEYTLTLLNYKTKQLDTLALEKSASALLEKKLCATPPIKALMDKGLTVRCLYRGSDLSPVASVVIQNTNCLR